MEDNTVIEEKLKKTRVIEIKEADGKITKVEKYILMSLDVLDEEKNQIQCQMAINDLTTKETEILFDTCKNQLEEHINEKKFESILKSKKGAKIVDDFIKFMEKRKKREKKEDQ